MNQRLINDSAYAMATALVEIVQNCIRPEERRDAFDAFYAACKAGLESYESQRARMLERLRPMEN